jgi:OOP family OmpA-OmpF porin
MEQWAYSLDALVVFGRENAVSPYITFGGGYIENDMNTNGEFGPLAQAGFGLLMDLGENSSRTFVFQIRPEVKYRHDWADGPTGDSHGDLLVNLGFSFTFGPSNEPPPPVMQAPPPAAPPPPTPAPSPPADTDGDGVMDPGDRCPGTPRGMAVDTAGCPRGGPVVLRGVEFATNSATLSPSSLPILDDVAADLKEHPRLKVELQGHTDSRGADAYNLDLSQRRADSVRNYLISQGVSGLQLVAKGYGESEPIADNATDLGRAENRRVVMQVLENPGRAEVQGGGN